MRSSRCLGAATVAAVALLFALLVSATHAAYDPALIVANLETDCPVPNVKYPPTQYSTDVLITTFTPLAAAIARKECQTQATSLAVCALDGSLGIQSGCCSTGCSAAMAQLKSLNCFQDILTTICTLGPQQEAQVQPFIPILATVAQRCANYQAPPSIACPNERTLSTASAVGPAGSFGAGAPAAEPPMPEGGMAAAMMLPGAADAHNTSMPAQPPAAPAASASPSPAP